MGVNQKDREFIGRLSGLSLIELENMAKVQCIKNYKTIDRDSLVMKLIEKFVGKSEIVFGRGVLQLCESGHGVIRVKNYFPSNKDSYISKSLIQKYGLLTGDDIYFTYESAIGEAKEALLEYQVVTVYVINGYDSKSLKKRQRFSDLTPIYPDKRLQLETDSGNIIGRLLDVFTPIGYGQRALIVSPPKAGKTTIMKSVANSISLNHPDIIIKVLLIDERPEEVTDMKRSIKGSVIFSTFDEPPEQHVKISELVLENAKRLVECGKDVVILLDSITRLARAYNLVVSPSGRTLSGGLDPNSLHKPKRFFGGARQIEKGGSLTVIATALVNTGSRMDDIIYEEFKGTGNMELHLDRNMANHRIFPAVDIVHSGTRKEELLIEPDALKKIYILRKNIHSESSIEELLTLMKRTESNHDFFHSPLFRE